MAHGITLQMRAIKKPEPQIVYAHTTGAPNRAARRSGAPLKRWTGANAPYINLGRDQRAVFGKKGRRLTIAATIAAWEAAHGIAVSPPAAA